MAHAVAPEDVRQPCDRRGRLTRDEVVRYEQDGFLGPLTALTTVQAASLLGAVESFETRLGQSLSAHPGQLRAKSHLLFPWLNELTRNPRILDAVQSLIGPDILVYHLTCWMKEPGDGTFVPWHQDGTYFGLDGPGHVTAWVALTDARADSGCMRMLPGSHRNGQLPHTDGQTKNNLLSNGQRVDWQFDAAKAIDLEMAAGSFSLHHTHVLHSSNPNRASHRRIGIGISYIPPRLGHVARGDLTASLVRGVDTYRHFGAEPIPAEVYGPDARKFHATSVRRFFDAHGLQRESLIDRDGLRGN